MRKQPFTRDEWRVYNQTPERRRYRLAYNAKPEVKTRRLARESTPSARLKQKEKNAKFRREHKDRARALTLDWLRRNPEWLANYQARRYALRRGAQGRHTAEEWQRLCEEHGHVCAYCGENVALTRDHVIPLTRGGSDNIENILPACQPCNSSKRNKTLEEWRSP